MASPTIRLNAGNEMPLLGLGVLNRERPDLTSHAVSAALNLGYRLFDTASVYNNERDVGEAIKAADISRPDIFVTTKLWIGHYGYDQTIRAFHASLKRLALEYVDLYLLHWPYPTRFDLTIASYRAVEHLKEQGLIKSIGVSNFGPELLQGLLREVKTVPAVNQVELHPFFAQRELRVIHAELGIVTQAWSPLGRSVGISKTRLLGSTPLEHPLIQSLSSKYSKSPAQIILRWHIQNGITVIPKSVNEHRLLKNAKIFDFELAPGDLAAIDTLDTGRRFSLEPDAVVPGTYPTIVAD